MRVRRHHFIHPPRWVQRLLHRIYLRVGYRGLALVTFGLLWFLIGISVYTSAGIIPPDPNLIHTKLPLAVRFGVWGVMGVWAFTMGIVRNHLRPTGFAALFIGPFERSCSYLYGLFATVHVGDPTPEWRYLTAFVLYVVLTVTILLFAGWPEPPDNLLEQVEGESL